MVSTETRYGLDSLSLNPGMERTFFSHLQKILKALYSTDTEVLSQGYSGWLGFDVHHSPPSSTKVKNEWRYTSTQPNAFVV